MNKEIVQLTSIRAVWAFVILMQHICVVYGSYIYLPIPVRGGWGVTNFTVLSGFLIAMHYGNVKSRSTDIKDGVLFGIRHMMKLYPLHLVTMGIMAVFNFLINLQAGILSRQIYLLLSVIMSIFLVQTWIPTQNFTVNDTSWYLSTIFALYIFTPWLLRIYKKITYKKASMYFGMIICLIIIYLLSDFIHDKLYVSPILRIYQFFIGMLLYKSIEKHFKIGNEMFVFFATAMEVFSEMQYFPHIRTVVDTMAVMLCIAAFYMYRGRLFTGRIWHEFGKASNEVFLIHIPVIRIGGMILLFFMPHDQYIIYIEIIILISISYILSFIWRYWYKKRNISKKIDNLEKYWLREREKLN